MTTQFISSQGKNIDFGRYVSMLKKEIGTRGEKFREKVMNSALDTALNNMYDVVIATSKGFGLDDPGNAESMIGNLFELSRVNEGSNRITIEWNLRHTDIQENHYARKFIYHGIESAKKAIISESQSLANSIFAGEGSKVLKSVVKDKSGKKKATTKSRTSSKKNVVRGLKAAETRRKNEARDIAKVSKLVADARASVGKSKKKK